MTRRRSFFAAALAFLSRKPAAAAPPPPTISFIGHGRIVVRFPQMNREQLAKIAGGVLRPGEAPQNLEQLLASADSITLVMTSEAQ